MIAEKYRSLSRWTRKMSELWLVNELDEKCSKQERLLIIIWILWFQVWHKYRNNNILTSLREWLIFTRRDCLSTNTFLKKRAWKSLIYWGFRHQEQVPLRVIGPSFYVRGNWSRSRVVAMILLFQKTSQRFYYFGENEKTILLFGVGRDYEFTDRRFLLQ